MMENMEEMQDMSLELLAEEENLDVEKAWALFCVDKKENFVVVQISPASRVALGDYFGLSRGEDGIGKVTAILRELGVDAVVDTAIAEDAVAILETKKLLANKNNREEKALFASRCAAFVAEAKEKYPTLCVSQIPATTTICGALLKEFYREQTGKSVRVIAIEPCYANKTLGGVDLVLTTEELVSILAETEVNLRLSRKDALDAPFGTCSGSGYVCAMSGGVADSIARCLSADKSQEALRKFSYSGLYGDKKCREANLTINGEAWKFAVVCGMAAAEELIAKIEKGEVSYDYVEVMACSGGCVGGDGQACVLGEGESVEHAVKARAQSLKYIESRRAAKAADMSASATTLARAWTDLERRGEIDCQPIDWNALFESITERFFEEISAQTQEETPIEEAVEVPQEESVEETVEIIEETAPIKEVEEVVEEAVEEVVEEITETVEETLLENEKVVEEEVAIAETVEEVFETDAMEETSTEETSTEEIVEEPIEEVVEEIIEEVAEETPAEENIEETPVEEVVVEEVSVEEIVEETPVEEVVVEVVEEEISEELIAEAEETCAECPEVEEVVEEVEEAVEETPVEDIVAEAADEEVIEETIEEMSIDESVEETIEEVVEEADETEVFVDGKRNPYYTRLSGRDRRKLKRKKKNRDL